MVERKNGETRIQQKNARKIIDAATIEFSKEGFRGGTLDAISRRAGLSKPNLLYYFRNKHDLYQAALNHVLDIWLSPLGELDPAADPEEQLRGYIEKKMDLSRKHPAASRMFANEILKGANNAGPDLEAKLGELASKFNKVWCHWQSENKVAQVDGLHLIFMIWAMTQHYADFEAQIKMLTGKTIADEAFYETARQNIIHIIFDGIKNRHPPHCDGVAEDV